MIMLGVIFIGILLGVFMSIPCENYEKTMGKDKRDN
jgi:hypothetical protein